MDMAESERLFDVLTPLGFSVRVTYAYWRFVTTVKHPVMAGRESIVQATLSEPDQVRRSRSDGAVYLFYRLSRPGRWTCVVVRRLNHEGFLVTTYPTDAVKEGIRVWPR
jgi:hypothetical protein